MLFTVDFQNGMTMTLKSENLHLVEHNGKTMLVTKTDVAIVPLATFPLHLATPEELAARETKATEEREVVRAVLDAPKRTAKV